MSIRAWHYLLWASLLAVCLTATSLHGQPAPASLPAVGQAVAPAQPPAEAPPLTELQKKMKTHVSVDFREAPIEDVIKSFAQQADIDIVKGPAVTGKVTATLTDVPLDEAMETIFSVHGFGYTMTDSIIRIVPRSELAQFMTKYVTKVYHIDYASMEEVTKAITPMLSTPGGKMASNPKTNDILITDTEDRVKALDEFIATMDREIPQILVEARIYDVSCSSSFDFGFDWSAGTFTLFDPDTGLAIGGRTEPFAGAAFSSSIHQTEKAAFGLRLGILNEDVNVDVMLKAAKDDVKAKLLANPKILVLNDQEANIQIVQEIPYQELTQTSGGGNIGTTKFKNVGVTLKVMAHLTRDNKVRLDLSPTFSARTGSVPITMPGGLTGAAITTQQPIVDTREATTQALISDGETVVIGGLRKRDVVQEISKVPFVGDIPVVGELFKFRGEKTVNSELVVFITPRVIAKPELSDSEARKLGRTETEFCEPGSPNPLFNCCEGQED
jgi:type IV pilus assembly protein PilQ